MEQHQQPNQDQQPELYGFLRRILEEAGGPYGSVIIQEGEYEWIKGYLEAQDIIINFRGERSGEEVNGDPIYKLHFQIAGHLVDILGLLNHACMQNADFRTAVAVAGSSAIEHMPFCEHCKSLPVGTWQFIEHPKIKTDGSTTTNPR